MATKRALLCFFTLLAASDAGAQAEVGVTPGQGPAAVRVFNASGGTAHDFDPYPGFTGGVRVALGDVNADGVADIVTAPGAGAAPVVRVFDGLTGQQLRAFFAYDAGFTGGVYVAAGDVDGDGRADIITGPGSGGGPHVKVFSGVTGSELRSFFAYDAGFTGGVYVATGDVNTDRRADIITGPGPGPVSGPHVKVFSGSDGALLHSFFAYGSGFSGGVYVGGGDFNGDGIDDIVTGAGADATAGPHVKVFDGLRLVEQASFFAYDVGFTGGVRVATGDVNGDGRADIITGPGPGAAPLVSRFVAPNATIGGSFFAFDTGFTGGVFVAGVTFLPVVLRDGFEDPPPD